MVKASKKFLFLRAWGRLAPFLMATALVSFPRCYYAHSPLLTLRIRFRSRSIDCRGFAQKTRDHYSRVRTSRIHAKSFRLTCRLTYLFEATPCRSLAGTQRNDQRSWKPQDYPDVHPRTGIIGFCLVTTATDKEMYLRNVRWKFDRRKSKLVFNYTNAFYGSRIAECTCTIFPLKSCRASWTNVFSQDILIA